MRIQNHQGLIVEAHVFDDEPDAYGGDGPAQGEESPMLETLFLFVVGGG